MVTQTNKPVRLKTCLQSGENQTYYFPLQSSYMHPASIGCCKDICYYASYKSFVERCIKTIRISNVTATDQQTVSESVRVLVLEKVHAWNDVAMLTIHQLSNHGKIEENKGGLNGRVTYPLTA